MSSVSPKFAVALLAALAVGMTAIPANGALLATLDIKLTSSGGMNASLGFASVSKAKDALHVQRNIESAIESIPCPMPGGMTSGQVSQTQVAAAAIPPKTLQSPVFGSSHRLIAIAADMFSQCTENRMLDPPR
jgi:hypothetical protein